LEIRPCPQNRHSFSPSEFSRTAASRCRAKELTPELRRTLSVQALSGNIPISRIADEYGVSRKFVYQQRHKGEKALKEAFSPPPDDETVLFYLPVTRTWLKQAVLALVLMCYSSIRGVSEFMRILLNTEMSPATVHNIIHQAIPSARQINCSYELSGIRAGAHDELFQGAMPVLGGMDLASGYCYLLTPAEHRDADTWGIHLLDCAKQGLHPDYTVADAGKGQRAGQAQVWDDVPCFGDKFHLMRDITRLSKKLDKTAYARITVRERLESEMQNAKRQGSGNRLSKALAHARRREADAVCIADNVRTLRDWLRQDILSLSGPETADRIMLYDFVTESLQELEADESRIRPLRRGLENQKAQVTAFARRLDDGIAEIARQFGISEYSVRLTVELLTRDPASKGYYTLEAALYRQIHHYLHPVREAADDLLSAIFRSSSMIENLNGRLRCSFFLRRQIGPAYLELLRFFLNHRPFMRSAHPEKIGKSPAELLTGKKHPHWLEMLGFKLFKRPAETV